MRLYQIKAMKMEREETEGGTIVVHFCGNLEACPFHFQSAALGSLDSPERVQSRAAHVRSDQEEFNIQILGSRR